MFRRESYSLIEILVVLALFTLILAAALEFVARGKDAWEIGGMRSHLQARARLAMAKIVDELKKATRAYPASPPNIYISPSNNQGITFYLPEDLDGDGTVTDSSGEVEWNTNSPVRYLYLPLERELCRIEGGATNVLSDYVDDVRFVDQSITNTLYINELNVSLILEKETSGKRVISARLNSTIRLRN